MELPFHLEPIEARVLGVLIEKALTTPEQYPLTLNALTNGANQKSNREPIMTLEDEECWSAIQTLTTKHLAETVYPMSSRVEKYRHKAKDMLALDAVGLGIMAELMMRGPQQPGELRVRASRMAMIGTQDALMAALAPLIERGLVRRLDPEPGSRAERYVQLLCPHAHPLDAPVSRVAPARAVAVTPDLVARVDALEAQVKDLRELCERLAREIGSL